MERRGIERWAERFPFAATLPRGRLRARLARVLQFPVLEAGAVAYEQDGACHNYLMCIEGRTRITKSSSAGREMLLYTVQQGGTCVLTTQCLLSRTNFPAESVAESRTTAGGGTGLLVLRLHGRDAGVPRLRHRRLHQAARLHVRLRRHAGLRHRGAAPRPPPCWSRPARRWWSPRRTSNSPPTSAAWREIVSRHLGEWERAGWVETEPRLGADRRPRRALTSRQPVA